MKLTRCSQLIAQVFKRAVREVKAGQTALEAGEGRGGDSTYFNRTIVILLHLVCLLTKLIPHLEKEKVSLSPFISAVQPSCQGHKG